MHILRLLFMSLVVMLLLTQQAKSARLKDLAKIRGVRNNQLSGYGVVAGLEGTGDRKSQLTSNSLGLVLRGLGVEQNLKDIDTANAAAVLVTAVLPPFSRQGAQIDVTVSSMGSARSLDGGTLLMTPLKGPDGTVYAMAQGKLITTRRGDRGRRTVTGQSQVTAHIPGGAIVEREVAFDLESKREVTYQLMSPDFTTAARIARTINEELGGKYATARDAGTVHVIFPYSDLSSAVDIIARVENVEIDADRRAKVVINQRTGTVVLGAQVKILPVAIAHNNLKVEVREPAQAEVPNPIFIPDDPNAAAAAAAAQPSPLTQLGVAGEKDRGNNVILMENGATIADVVATLNEMGASADDVISLLQSLKASGALLAEVVVQ